MKYDVFISYRRNGGEHTAKILKDRLEDLGYKVFFDVESLRSGDFNTKLYSVIEECQDFVLVLSPDSLERCENEGDWVRLEIEHALKNNKNIVPVMLRGFTFPEKLPDSIDSLRFKNGLEANSEFFDAFIQKLQKFLNTKTNLFRRLTQNIIFKRTWPVLLSLVILTGLIYGGITVYNMNKKNAYPNSQTENNLVSEIFMYVQNNLSISNEITRQVNDAYKACDQYLVNKDDLSYQQAISQITTSITNINKLKISDNILNSDVSNKIDNSPFDKADVISFNKYLSEMNIHFQTNLQSLKYYINPQSKLDLSVKREILEQDKKQLELFTTDMVYSTNYILLPIDAQYKGLKDFKRDVLPVMTSLPFDKHTWSTDKSELENLINTNVKKLEDIVNKESQLVGNINVPLMQQKADMVKQLEQAGMSQKDAEAYVANILQHSDNTTNLQKQIDETKQKTEQLKENAKTKFAPLQTDTSDIIWGKMLRFLTLQMPNQAIECAQAYYMKVKDSKEDYEKDASTFIPILIQYIKQISKTGIDYGTMVVGFSSQQTNHYFYHIGDIIVAVNKTSCKNFDEMNALKKDNQDNVITIMRLNSKGEFEFKDFTLNGKGEKCVWLNNLTEN